MIITTRSGRSYNTETDLNAPERHILQKLFIWESMASSIAVFRQKKEEALLKGWNHSGDPGTRSPNRSSLTWKKKYPFGQRGDEGRR